MRNIAIESTSIYNNVIGIDPEPWNWGSCFLQLSYPEELQAFIEHLQSLAKELGWELDPWYAH